MVPVRAVPAAPLPAAPVRRVEQRPQVDTGQQLVAIDRVDVAGSVGPAGSGVVP